MQEEPAGVDYLLYSLVDLRNQEMAKITTDAALVNHWKGYIPAEIADGAQLMVADDREEKRLISLGYTRLGDYVGTGYEKGRRGYYYSSVSGANSYQQGVMQTVQGTAMGIDPRTGRDRSGLTGGVIWGYQASDIEGLFRSHGVKPGAREALIPVLDGDGNVVAYERSLSPEMRAKVSRDRHLGRMMGAWAGRIQEEKLAQQFNELLVDELKKNWDEGKRTRRSAEYVDVSNQLDKVFGEAWDMIPPETKEYIENVFANEPGFMIRKDMINNALGYRMPSIKDAWDGASRLDPAVKKVIRNTATVILGKNALPWLVTSEKAWMAGISMAKNTIVVRSVIVPFPRS